MPRTCSLCNQPGGPGPRELRPYGKGGADVCAGCVFGEGDKPPREGAEAEAERQLLTRLMTPGPFLLTDEGPIPMAPKGKPS